MITLVRDNQPVGRIVLSPEAEPVELRAARELQRVVQHMSGACLAITKRTDDRDSILIGRAARDAGHDLSEERLGLDGYVIETGSNQLILAGSQPYSSLYAVYRFLEEWAGCGFFEEGEQLPKRSTMTAEDIQVVSKPRFEWRIYFANMQDAYSGMRWWTWDEFKPWIDYLVKKRFNIIDSGNIADCCGIGALAAGELGIVIPLNDWQKERIKLLRRVFDYARESGVRVLYRMHLHVGTPNARPGFSSYADGQQLQMFVDQHKVQTGKPIAVVPLEWCGEKEIVLDPRDPVTQDFTSAVVTVYSEALGTDHLYGLWLPTEEVWTEEDPAKAAELTHASVNGMIDAIRSVDPDATIFSPRVCTDNPTAAAQAVAVREASLPVLGNMFLNHDGRMYDFLQCDYYWGLPWSTGMCGQCGRETNPNGDIKTAIVNARSLADHPRASNLRGFMVSSETNRRNVMTMDLYAELSWNPAYLDADRYVQSWNERRYGDSAPHTEVAVRLFADTVMSYFDPCMHNGPLFRNWDGTTLPGLTAGSVKRLIGFLPALHEIITVLLAEHDSLKSSPMYRFDLVDLGRTYLAGIFNDRLARSRKSFRSRDRSAFERYASETEEVMRNMAHCCSAHEQFRLKTHDDWAARWPQILPGHENSESNWITFTALISLENWQVLLDYLPEDFAEMIVHYFLPRVQLYIGKMREQLESHSEISGRLVDRGTDIDLPSRVANWATPQGNTPWSAYGDTCEPELTSEDEALALRLIHAGTVSGKFDYYEGPLAPLISDMLERYPPPDDIDSILSEKDYVPADSRTVLAGVPGEIMQGFNVPGFVERVAVSPELASCITVQEIRKEYSIARGEISLYQILVHPEVHLTRQENIKASTDGHDIAVYTFRSQGRAYRIQYDSGTNTEVATFTTVPE